MKQLLRSEKALLVLGTFIFCASSYLFLFQADRISALFGFPTLGPRVRVGKVEFRKNMTRRKLAGGNQFSPIEEQQEIFSRDSVMTGDESGIKLSLIDGSELELGPDTLIEIKFNNDNGGFGQSEFTINVARGQVKGNSPHLTVVQKADTKKNSVSSTTKSPTPEASATIAAVPIASATIAAVPETPPCALSNLTVLSPTLTKDAFPEIQARLQCQKSTQKNSIQVLNEKNEIIFDRVVDIKDGVNENLDITVKTPGIFLVRSSLFTAPSKIAVPETFADLSWADDPVICERKLVFKAPDTILEMSGKLNLIDNETLETILQRPWDRKPGFRFDKTVHLPKTVSVRLALNNGFVLTSPPFTFVHFKECLSLKNPASKATLRFKDAAILFTWVYQDKETYEFRIATDSKLRNLVAKRTTITNFLRLKLDYPGTYYWQISSSSGDKSPVRMFKVY